MCFSQRDKHEIGRDLICPEFITFLLAPQYFLRAF